MAKKKRGAPPEVIFKHLAFEKKNVSAEPDADGFVYIEAYASVFDNVDSHNEMIAKGAYTETLKAWAADGVPIPSFYNHGIFSNDPHDNVGFLPEAREDDYGLKVRVALDVEHNTKAAYLHRLIMQERLRELSVTIRAREWELVHEDDKREWEYTRKLTRVDLLEVSLVPAASNPLAKVTSKAAALAYGGSKAEGDEEEVDDDESEAPSAEAIKSALVALADARAALDVAEAALAESAEEVEPVDDPDEGEEEPSDDDSKKSATDVVVEKSLSARARVALAMTVLASTE